MATDFWGSSHYRRWIVDRTTLLQARADDLHYVDRAENLEFMGIYFANIISKLCKKLQLRQRVIATATVFFRRFYLKNTYCETDPFTVIAACCYVAAKAEECPQHIKTVINESRALFSQEMYGVKHFSSDNTKLAEMEFYLVGDLECDLIVFHPYRTLLTLCTATESKNTSSPNSEEGEADDTGVGIGVEDGPRYWGTGDGQLELAPAALQTAWSIINDTYRSQLCLLHPPHLIAIAAIYLTFILHPPASSDSTDSIDVVPDTPVDPSPSTKNPRRSSRQAQAAAASTSTSQPKKPQDPITFLSELNVSLPLVATIAQEIISLYTLWDRYKEDVSPEAAKLARDVSSSNSPVAGTSGPSPLKRTHSGHSPSQSQTSRTGTVARSNTFSPSIEDGDSTPTPPIRAPPPFGSRIEVSTPVVYIPSERIVTPAMLSSSLLKMREKRLTDIAPTAAAAGLLTPAPSSAGIQVVHGHGHGHGARAINKRLERTQAVG